MPPLWVPLQSRMLHAGQPPFMVCCLGPTPTQPLTVASFLKHPCAASTNRFISAKAARLSSHQPGSPGGLICCSSSSSSSSSCFAWGHALRGARSNGCRCQAFFNFGKKSGNAEPAAGRREDYSPEDVEYYFNYMGMLAEEGSYDSLDALVQSGIAPVDVLLLMACSENDAPKVSELLDAGADVSVKRKDGKGPMDLATSDAVKELLKSPAAAS